MDFQNMMRREQEEKLERYRVLNRNVQKGRILFTGSSLMEQFPINELLMTNGMSQVIYNRGIGGFTTGDMLQHMEEMVFGTEPSKIFINIGTNDIGSPDYKLAALLEKYEKIISLTKKNNTRLVLMVTPYIITNEDMRAYNKIAEIAGEEGITFINYCEYFDEIGLDFEKDFNDESHLNYWGSCKFTDFLGGFLDCDDAIPDRRGEEGYESWDDNVQMIYDKLESYENGTLEKLEY